jgi:hypothetical protein
MFKSQVSTATATGDTSKTLIDTITVPDGVSRIVGVCAQAVAGASVTIAEPITGILELESDDAPVTPAQFILDCVVLLTSGMAAFNPRVWAVSIPVKAGNRIKGSITMDMAMTGALKGRFMLIYD